MRNKKIISFICALAMIVSLFSGFSVSADTSKGIALEAGLSEDAKTLTVVATAKDYDEAGILSAAIVFDIPEGSKAAEAAYTSTAAGKDITWVFNIADNQVLMNFYDAAGNPVKFDDDVLATITIPYETAISKNFDIKLVDGTTMEDANGTAKVKNSTMEATTVSVESPLAKPSAGDRGDKQDEGGSDTPTVSPVPADPQKTGISLAASMSEDNKTMTVVAKALNYDENGILSAAIVFDVPETVKAAEASYASTAGGKDVTWVFNVADNQVLMNFYDAAGNPVKFDDDVLATITLPLSEALTEPFALTMADGTTLEDANGTVKTKNDTMTKVVEVVEPTEAGSDEPLPESRDADLEDYIGGDGDKTAAEVAKEYEDDATKTGDLYLTVEIKKDDPDNAGQKIDAVYGEDFVAEYDGKTLSKAEYENLINGYTDEKMSDVISGLKFKVFNSAKGVTISSYLNVENEDGTAEALTNKPAAADTEVDDPGTTPETPSGAKDSTLTVTGKQNKSTIKSGAALSTGIDVVLTPAIVLGNDKDGKAYTQTGDLTVTATSATFSGVANGAIKVTYNDADAKAVEKYLTLSNFADGVVVPADATDVKVSFTTFNASTSATQAIDVTFAAKASDKDLTDTFKLTVNKASNNTTKTTTKNGGSGNNTSSSGNGAIASGMTDIDDGGYIPKSAHFEDLGDVPWAADAINALADKNIVNGRSDTEFDPNANITRAEYAQILINAIGRQGDSADTTFDDVPTDAWYYHNVAVAAQLGIVSGYGDGNFGPFDLITREQMALMTQKAAQVIGKDLSAQTEASFTDADEISDWAAEAVQELANAGIINGMGDGTFAPKANATRAQAAVIIYSGIVK